MGFLHGDSFLCKNLLKVAACKKFCRAAFIFYSLATCDLFLQMQYPGFDFFRLAYVPEIFSQISAGAAGHVHLGVVLVMALGAFPLVVIVDHDLPVIAADHAVV